MDLRFVQRVIQYNQNQDKQRKAKEKEAEAKRREVTTHDQDEITKILQMQKKHYKKMEELRNGHNK